MIYILVAIDCVTYYTKELTERLSEVFIRSTGIVPPVSIFSTSTSPFFRKMVYNDSIVNVLPRHYHLSVQAQNVPMMITHLSILPTNVIQMRNVTIHEKQQPIVLTCKRCQNVWEYHGNNPYVAKCSFCKTTVSVLKHKQKATASGLTLAGTGQNAATTTPTEGAAVNDK
jgi:hypothetical protein